jgi:hypothetical protein
VCTTPPQEALNQFVFSFASRPAQLSRIITFDLLGIDQDYLFKWVQQPQSGCLDIIVKP